MLSILLALGLLAIGTLLLVVGADWFMDGAGDLARLFGVSALILGILLAGLEPEEMLTAAIASARGVPGLAVGNVIGTNITIVTLALGLSALIAPIALRRTVRRQALIATLVSIVPIALLLTGLVTRLEGFLLLLLFIVYTSVLFWVDRESLRNLVELEADDDDDDETEAPGRSTYKRFPWKAVAQTVGGLVAMTIGGPAIVEGALRLTQAVGLSTGIVGATVVSLGTGAEMIALGISAARKQKAELLVGGIIGSFAYNLLVTLGLAAAIRPVPVEPRLLFIALPIMVVAHLALLALIWYSKLNRLAGAIFVLAYVVYLFGVVFG